MIRAAFDKMNARVVTIDSQSYVADFYHRMGFRQTSEEFVLEGIPHVRMELARNDWEKA